MAMMSKKELYKELYIAIGDNARAICREKHLGIGAVEKRVGLIQGYLASLSSGLRSISLGKTKALADELGCTIDNLLDKDYVINQRINELQTELDTLIRIKNAQ